MVIVREATEEDMPRIRELAMQIQKQHEDYGETNKLKSDFSTSVSLVAMWKNQGPKKPTRAVGEHATSL